MEDFSYKLDKRLMLQKIIMYLNSWGNIFILPIRAL